MIYEGISQLEQALFAMENSPVITRATRDVDGNIHPVALAIMAATVVSVSEGRMNDVSGEIVGAAQMIAEGLAR